MTSITSVVVASPAAKGTPGRSSTGGSRPTTSFQTRGGEWPRTSRLLPWLLAGFLVMVWLIPFDAIELPVHLPVDSKLDRFALTLLCVVWIASIVAADPVGPRFRRSALHGAVLLFLAVVVAGVLTNLGTLANVGELGLLVKKIALLLSYIIFFYIVATVIRPTELRNFGILIVVLASITAIGTIYEYRTDFNAFYQWGHKLAPKSINFAPEPGDPVSGRPSITGPTAHGLAVAVMFAMALPFAVLGIVRSSEIRAKLLYAAATGLILAGGFATYRKTAVLAPAAALATLIAYRPKEMLRFLPLGIVLIGVSYLLAPGALESLRTQLQPSYMSSTLTVQDRKNDYDAVRPDVEKHLFIGRGYGTYDPHKYRILDNQYLGLLIETGFIGVGAYLLMLLAAVGTAHRSIRSWDPVRGPPALAVAAGVIAFGVASALFDVLAFPQAPYMFFFLAGLAVVCSSSSETTTEAGARVRASAERKLIQLPYCPPTYRWGRGGWRGKAAKSPPAPTLSRRGGHHHGAVKRPPPPDRTSLPRRSLRPSEAETTGRTHPS